ncbi:hypothetical protein [Marisediminicola antarctica]|uniref:hypothetical protein n=1 Tax=Marisediminicola antarctica TaxID=674079 RepID=UPI00137A6344|nr:hypothetical protein [Marisediminicola antarctica]
MTHGFAILHHGLTFEAIQVGANGFYDIRPAQSDVEPDVIARIAMAGPCVDLAVQMLESGDTTSDAVLSEHMARWTSDVTYNHDGYVTDLYDARGYLREAAAWALAFSESNLDLIRKAAENLIDNGGVMSYDEFQIRFADAIEAVDQTILTDSIRILFTVDDAIEYVDWKIEDRAEDLKAEADERIARTDAGSPSHE